MLPVIALLVGLTAPPAVAGPPLADSTPQLQHARMSKAMLARVYRLSAQEAAARCPGAIEALTFVFLVEPVADDAEPTMTETRDFAVDGVSYRTSSIQALGHAIEPLTVIDNISDLVGVFPELPSLLPSTFKPIHGFIVTIGGMALPPRGTGEVVLKTGYHRETEPFVFRFPIPPKPGA